MTRRRHPAGQAGIALMASMEPLVPLHDDGFCDGEHEDGDDAGAGPAVQPAAQLPNDAQEPTNSDGAPGFDWNFGDVLEFDTGFERVDIGLPRPDVDEVASTSTQSAAGEEDGINIRARVLWTPFEDMEGGLQFCLHREERRADPEKRGQYLTEGRISPTGGYVNPNGENIPGPYAFAKLDEAMQQLEANKDADSHLFFYPMNRLMSIEMAKLARGRNFDVIRWKRTNGVFGFNYFLVLYKRK
jgi:hypothetical protein